jgi:hypothetical protein
MDAKFAGTLGVAKSNPASGRFRDLEKLVLAPGYELKRQNGSHRIYSRRGLPMINLRSDGAMAKAYQVKQVREIIETHKLEVS